MPNQSDSDDEKLPDGCIWKTLPTGQSLHNFAVLLGQNPENIIDLNVSEGIISDAQQGQEAAPDNTPVLFFEPAISPLEAQTDSQTEETVPAIKAPVCPFCNKDNPALPKDGWHHLFIKDAVGTNKRQDRTYKLVENIWGDNWKTDFFSKNMFYMGSRSFAVHHLISISQVRENFWHTVFSHNGYDINCGENLVTMPTITSVACEIGMQVHRSNHYGTPIRVKRDSESESTVVYFDDDFEDDKTYHDHVKDKMAVLYQDIVTGKLCDSPPDAIFNRMKKASDELAKMINSFKASLTVHSDYFHPKDDHGCCGSKSISDIGNDSPACPDRAVANSTEIDIDESKLTHKKDWDTRNLRLVPNGDPLKDPQKRIQEAKSKLQKTNGIQPKDAHFGAPQ